MLCSSNCPPGCLHTAACGSRCRKWPPKTCRQGGTQISGGRRRGDRQARSARRRAAAPAVKQFLVCWREYNGQHVWMLPHAAAALRAPELGAAAAAAQPGCTRHRNPTRFGILHRSPDRVIVASGGQHNRGAHFGRAPPRRCSALSGGLSQGAASLRGRGAARVRSSVLRAGKGCTLARQAVPARAESVIGFTN